MEYKVTKSNSPISKEQCNQLAAKGMKLITALQWEGWFYFYFEVRVPN